jgi:hypothetical protein
MANKFQIEYPAQRCPYPHCSDCKTRRGNNLGNRRVRHAVKALLHKMKEDV